MSEEISYKCIDGCCHLDFTHELVSVPRHRRGYCKKAGVFIYDPKSERVLLVQSRGQLWGPPKGTLEVLLHESHCQCAIREVFEETGISLNTEQFTQAIKIKNKALYYYVELPYCPVKIQDHPNNDANGITWIKVNCLEKLIKNGQIILNEHCRILFKKFLGKVFAQEEFIKVKRRKN